MRTIDPDEILRSVQQETPEKGLPPVHLWHPERSGEIDIQIKKDGRWFHEGEEIVRQSLARLFSTILRLDEDGEYYLVTPVEKLKIQVEDTPFIAASFFVEPAQQGKAMKLVFATNFGDPVVLDQKNQLTVEYPKGEGSEPRPLVEVRNGLLARVSHSAFYQLVDMATKERTEEGPVLMIRSDGEEYILGKL